MAKFAAFKSATLLWITLGVTLLYSVIAPFSYFRHDDWIHLGNSTVLLPQDWSLLWRATQYYSPLAELVWFFRPFVKLLVYLNFEAFGFQHWAWLLSQWAFTLGAIFFGALAIQELWKDRQRTQFFVVASLMSIHLHFGSVAWVGEGVMNCPQLLFLALALYTFAVNLTRNRGPVFLASIVFYLIALGFKESSAFFPFLLSAILYQKDLLRPLRGKLLIFFAVFAVYLYYRLGVLPFNPGYRPDLLHMDGKWLPLASLIGLLGLTFACTLFFGRIRLAAFWPYLAFLGLTVAPHLGHSFFSPGWLLLPGYFLLWVLASTVEFRPLNLKWVALAFLLSSGIPVAYRTHQLGWIHWYKNQMQVHQFIQALPDQGEEFLVVENCPSPKYPGVDLSRMVGAANNLEHIWLLNHPRPIKAFVPNCGNMPQDRPKDRIHTTWTWDGLKFAE